MALGAGRQRIDDRIDHGAGVLLVRKPGDAVAAGEPILELLYNDDRGEADAARLAASAIEVSAEPPARRPLVIDRIVPGAP
jgi:pyrimidine-nucleoside phosphorylase/thymidine phosphorylase